MRGDREARARTRDVTATAASDSDHDAGFRIDESFARFSQVDDVFSRSSWDDTVRSETSQKFYATYRRPLADWKKAPGFEQRDYAFRNAAWHVTDLIAEFEAGGRSRDGFLDPLSALREGPDERVDCGTPEKAAVDLKHVARVIGADLVGVTSTDERWIYTERFSAADRGPKANPMPAGLEHCIVIGQAMDPDLIQTAPSALAGASTGLGYSHDVVVLLTLAQYIKNLGYEAVPSMNDSALAIPLAIKAGLGEYGKHGLLITPEFGPSVRLGKIFTDLPLAHDRPIRFGVEEMCSICNACSKACPGRAIPDNEPNAELHNQSNISGITKWTVDGEKCFKYWSKINSDCSVCIRVCPYTRDYRSRANRAWLRLSNSPLRKLALRLDRRRGGGDRQAAADWWPVDITPRP